MLFIYLYITFISFLEKVKIFQIWYYKVISI